MSGHIRCGCPLTDLWEADRAQLCTATSGVLHPLPGGLISMCPPEEECTDVIVHRCQGTGWHTTGGTTVDGWYRRHEDQDPLAGQLALFGAVA